MPALLTRMSRPPSASTVFAKNDLTCASSRTSQTKPTQRPPPAWFNSATVLSISSSRRALSETFAPALTSARVIGYPAPLFPPVTIAVLFASEAINVSGGQLRAQPFVHDLRIGLPFRRLNHLAHEEPEQRFLAAAIIANLIGVRSDDRVDEGIDLARIADLHQSLFFNDRERALTAFKHLNQNVFRLLAANLLFVDQTYEHAQLFGGNR